MKNTSPKGYALIFAILLGMAALNVFLSQINLDGWNATLILTVAFTQAFILAAYFMHLRESPRFTWVIVFSGFFFVAVLGTYVAADSYGRSKQQLPTTWELPQTVNLPAAPAHAGK